MVEVTIPGKLVLSCVRTQAEKAMKFLTQTFYLALTLNLAIDLS